MATQFPSTYATFGLTSQAGIITDSIVWNYEQDSKEIRNGAGDVSGKTYYNERITGALAGFLPVATPYATDLATAMTITTAPTDFLKGSIGAVYIVESITVTQSNEEYKRIEVNVMNHPVLVS